MGGGRKDKKPRATKRATNNGKANDIGMKAELDNGKTNGHS